MLHVWDFDQGIPVVSQSRDVFTDYLLICSSITYSKRNFAYAMKFVYLIIKCFFLILSFLLLAFPSLTESKKTVLADTDSDVFVTTKYGTLRGFQTRFLNGKEVGGVGEEGNAKPTQRAVNIFRGIPFARPPVRFEVRILMLSDY